MKPIDTAVEKILNGDIVAVPTETVYGLAGAIDSEAAINKIFKIKERPFFDPLIVHVSSTEMAQSLSINWNSLCDKLAESFWPGPLTIVTPKSILVSDLITSGLESVGIRFPDHPVAIELINRTNKPLAAPSANKFTKTSPTSSAHVKSEFGDDVFILEGGLCDIGIESTVVGVFENEIKIYRPGMISMTEISEAIADKSIKITYTESPVSPGALKHHYMPKKKVSLYRENPNELNASVWVVPDSPEQAARLLYSKLREMDNETSEKINIILDPRYMNLDSYKGILNRLDKAKTFDFYFT